VHHPTCPSTPKVLQARECTPTPSPSIVFTFGLVVESIKEFENVSIVALQCAYAIFILRCAIVVDEGPFMLGVL